MLREQKAGGSTPYIHVPKDQKLGLLASMGIQLTPVSKLPEVEIDTLLHGAMDAAQGFEGGDFFPLDLNTLEGWSNLGSPIGDAFHDQRSSALSPTAPLYSETFANVIAKLGHIGLMLDRGHNVFVLQDDDTEYGISLRVSVASLHLCLLRIGLRYSRFLRCARQPMGGPC